MSEFKSPESQPESPSPWAKMGILLRRREQITMFGILLVCGGFLAVYFLQLYICQSCKAQQGFTQLFSRLTASQLLAKF